ncbi:hypothetical protein IWQ60_001517 [Tieghemiomyces parasiticus]|uniref:Uncharacterized protein n=1 Tax=Tieghemiomyces parasiticus TaxID=78921 RepID=A0A9W8AE10_9FUNG|nr:hypothetical protein IWQ60_001517 [Tieghemiomyces parasiticus]
MYPSASPYSLQGLADQLTSLAIGNDTTVDDCIDVENTYTGSPAVYIAEPETPMFWPPSPSLRATIQDNEGHYEQNLDSCYYVPESYRGIQCVKTVSYTYKDPDSLDAPEIPDLRGLSLGTDDKESPLSVGASAQPPPQCTPMVRPTNINPTQAAASSLSSGST